MNRGLFFPKKYSLQLYSLQFRKIDENLQTYLFFKKMFPF